MKTHLLAVLTGLACCGAASAQEQHRTYRCTVADAGYQWSFASLKTGTFRSTKQLWRSARVTDQQTNEALRKLIDGMQAQKAELHPEQQER